MLRRGGRSTFDGIRAGGGLPVGTFQAVADATVTEIAGIAGFDFVIIDGEHSPMGPSDWLPLIRSAEVAGVLPFVRIMENSRPLVQKAIDAGAEGIVVPHIDSVEAAEALVAAVRFPKDGGTRSLCPAGHGPQYTMAKWDEFVSHSAENLLVIPIIESRQAMDDIEGIVAVDGIDWILYGPGDLSVDLGVSMTDPIMETLWQRAASAARAAGVKIMVPDLVPGIDTDGPDAVILGMDTMHIANAFTALVEGARDRYRAPRPA